MARTQTPNNTFRFMPGRVQAADDGKMLFNGLRYSRNAIPDSVKGFLAGVAIGPGQHLPKDVDGLGFELSAGGVIVPAFPKNSIPVPVRDFTPPGDKTGKPKQFVDWATFQKMGDQIFRVVPFEEDKVAYVEVWSGDFDESEGAYQLIQADLFAHGSVAYSGGTVVIDAPSTKKSQKPHPTDEGVRASQAELVGERQGTIVAGIPLWTARLWRIHYSEHDSEAVLVRQHQNYYLVMIEKDGLVANLVPPRRFGKSFERLKGDELTATASAVAA